MTGRAIRLLAACAAGLAICCAPEQEAASGDEAGRLRPLASTLARDIDLEAGGGPPVVGLDYLAADSVGNLFVLDASAGHLHKYTAAGRHVGTLAGADGEPVFLRQPAGPSPGGVVVGRDGNVYVAAAPHGMFDPELTENWVKGAVTRVSPALAVDTVFTIRGPEVVGGLSASPRELAVVLGRPRDAVERRFGLTEEEVLAREEVLLLTYDGVPTTAFIPQTNEGTECPIGEDGSEPTQPPRATNSWSSAPFIRFIVTGREENWQEPSGARRLLSGNRAGRSLGRSLRRMRDTTSGGVRSRP